MPTTPNKGYEVQVTSSNVGTWGDILNADMISIVDNNLGGIVTKSVAGSNITLNSTEAQNCIIRLTGAQSADVQITNPCIGFYFVENLTTNSFNITMTNGVAGVVVPKGRCSIIADTTNGCRIAGTDSFPTGTRMSFQQTAAPTGWTKDTSSTDFAFRGTSGTVGTGGSVAFTTAFVSQAVTGVTDGTAITINQMPSHTHTLDVRFSTSTGGSSNPGYIIGPPQGTRSDLATNENTGGGAPHTHSFTGNPINLAVKYVDFIVAVKN